MIKRILFITAIITSFYGKAQVTETIAEEQIKLVMKFQEASWNRGNVAEYMKGYWKSDSLIFVGAKGPTYGWSQTLANYLKSYPTPEKMGQLAFEFVKIEILSPVDAFVIGKWQLKRKEDTLQGYFSLLWKKIDGEWVIVADHSSSSD